MFTQSIDAIQAKVAAAQPLTKEEATIWADHTWEYFSSLRLTHDGRIVTPEEYEASERERQQREPQIKQTHEERENRRKWTSTDFDNLNTLIIQYKQTGDEHFFELAWDKYLHELTYNLVNKYVVKGLPTKAKQLFLTGNTYYDLRDELYIVLVDAINNWNPNAPDRNTKDFAAFYIKAAYNHVGGYKTRLKRPQYENVTEIRPVDFNNNQEVNMLTQNLKQHFHIESDTDYILMDMYVEEFIKTRLTKEQAILLGLLITERLPITEIAKYMKTSRMTVYRKIEDVKTLWLQYEEGSN